MAGKTGHSTCQLQGVSGLGSRAHPSTGNMSTAGCVSVKDSAWLHWLRGARGLLERGHSLGRQPLVEPGVANDAVNGDARVLQGAHAHAHGHRHAGRQDCWHSGSRESALFVGRQCTHSCTHSRRVTTCTLLPTATAHQPHTWLVSNILSKRSLHSAVSLMTALLLLGCSCQLLRICCSLRGGTASTNTAQHRCHVMVCWSLGMPQTACAVGALRPSHAAAAHGSTRARTRRPGTDGRQQATHHMLYSPAVLT